jgi:hypothetical protein
MDENHDLHANFWMNIMEIMMKSMTFSMIPFEFCSILGPRSEEGWHCAPGFVGHVPELRSSDGFAHYKTYKTIKNL